MHEPDVSRRRAAMQRLLAIPGVMRVGYGIKQTTGQVTGEHAYRVYVARKQPLDEVPPAERVPAQIDGVATDVLPIDVRRPMSKTPSIAAGDTIQRYIPNDWQASGTLGAIVRFGAAGDRYILTNQHVLDDTSNLFTGAYDVYDPHRKTCAEIQCNNPVAQISANSGIRGLRTEPDGNPYFVDCALAKIGAGVTATNRVPDIGALDQGVRDLSLEVNTPNIGVQKHGSRTGTTAGTVIEWHAMNGPNDDPPNIESWELRIHPAPGATLNNSWTLVSDVDQSGKLTSFTGTTVTATITTAGDTQTLHASGKIMADHGDSGSIVVDTQRRVVGLLWAAYTIKFDVLIDDEQRTIDVPAGDAAVANFIPVCHALGLDPATAVIPPAATSAGAALAREEWPEPRNADNDRALRDLEALAAATPVGRRLIALLGAHYPELANLVHHRRRVKVTWHRNRGPAFVAAALHAMRGRDVPLPGTVGGVRLADALARMRVALVAEGSPALAAAIEAEADTILRVAERATSVPALLAALRDGA